MKKFFAFIFFLLVGSQNLVAMENNVKKYNIHLLGNIDENKFEDEFFSVHLEHVRLCRVNVNFIKGEPFSEKIVDGFFIFYIIDAKSFNEGNYPSVEEISALAKIQQKYFKEARRDQIVKILITNIANYNRDQIRSKFQDLVNNKNNMVIREDDSHFFNGENMFIRESDFYFFEGEIVRDQVLEGLYGSLPHWH